MFNISFFFNDTATTEIYTLSLHDALPISLAGAYPVSKIAGGGLVARDSRVAGRPDRKSTRLNSSHPSISYAVFCLKKKKKYYHKLNITLITLNLYENPSRFTTLNASFLTF